MSSSTSVGSSVVFREIRIWRLPSSPIGSASCKARFFAGDYAGALEASSRGATDIGATLVILQASEYHFYGALSRAAACNTAAAGERQQHQDAIAAHHRQLEILGGELSGDFENRAALVGAEIARLDGRDVDAMRLYEQAIRSARANASSTTRRSPMNWPRGFYAGAWLRPRLPVCICGTPATAMCAGAPTARLRQLDELYPHLREQAPTPAPTSTIGAPVEHLDLATVIKVSAGRLGRDRPGNPDRHADAHRHRAGRSRAGPVLLHAEPGRGSRRKPRRPATRSWCSCTTRR